MYRQIDGIAMGGPLGPTMLNIFISFLGKICLLACIEGPKYNVRYVDDIFCVFENDVEAGCFNKTLKSLHPALHFT